MIMNTTKQEPPLSFNVFHFLNIERREDVLHTPIITGLLKQSCHTGNNIFLVEFFKMLRNHNIKIPNVGALSSYHWRIEAEKIVNSKEKGKIDILISSDKLKIAFIIENKIDAEEGHMQINKYAEWAEMYYNSYYIFLLSPDGRGSSSQGQRQCSSISYDNILQWLQTCITSVANLELKYILRCYIEVVKGIVPRQNIEPLGKLGLRIVPPTEYSQDALTILTNVKNRLDQEPRLKDLTFIVNEDITYNKYHGIIAIHKTFDRLTDKKLIWMRHEIIMGNKAHNGLLIGYHWKNTAAKFQHPAVGTLNELNLLDQYGHKEGHYPTDEARKNQWVSFKKYIYKQRTDESLLAVLDKNFTFIANRVVNETVNLFNDSGDLWFATNKAIIDRNMA